MKIFWWGLTYFLRFWQVYTMSHIFFKDTLLRLRTMLDTSFVFEITRGPDIKMIVSLDHHHLIIITHNTNIIYSHLIMRSETYGWSSFNLGITLYYPSVTRCVVSPQCQEGWGGLLCSVSAINTGKTDIRGFCWHQRRTQRRQQHSAVEAKITRDQPSSSFLSKNHPATSKHKPYVQYHTLDNIFSVSRTWTIFVSWVRLIWGWSLVTS